VAPVRERRDVCRIAGTLDPVCLKRTSPESLGIDERESRRAAPLAACPAFPDARSAAV